MRVQQISIFLENRAGRLKDVCALLGQNSINIRALTVAETETFGVLRIVVDDTDKAMEALKTGSYTANITQVVVVEIDDQPGGLAKVLDVLDENSINIEYLYAFVEKKVDKAMVVFRFEAPEKAIETLKANDINIATDINV